jgi:WD40 repeat protein
VSDATTTARATIDDQNPWPGLGAFDESAERFFNGRRTERAELRRLILHAPLTVLFGASGLGKTSLLQAGLFPLLRKEHHLPVYVRLDVRDRRAPLIEQVAFELRKECEAHGVEAPAWREREHEQESLWAYLHRAGLELWSEQNQLLTPVFVFDQFEEVFTLGAENAAAIARLRVDLADLIENRLPTDLARTIAGDDVAAGSLSLDSQHYKVLLSFREDFLPAVEGWKRELPSILRNRLRLLPMSGDQAFEAVHTTAPHLVDEPLARDIVRFVAAAQDDSGITAGESEGLRELAVEPALLSLVCHGLNEKRKAQGKATFDAALLQGTGRTVIADYYQQAVGDLPDQVQRFIENELITERGFRKPCDLDDARTIHGVKESDLRLLVDRRLLRIEPQRGTDRVELTHDLLTHVVRDRRDTQREHMRVRRQRRRAGGIIVLGAALVGLVVLFVVLSVDASNQRDIARRASAETRTALRRAEEFSREAEESLKRQRTLSDQIIAQSIANVKVTEEAATARHEAERQLTIVSANRLTSEAFFRFDTPATGLATSGALAVLSLQSAPTTEAMRALSQVLRLIPPAPQIIPHAHQQPVQSLAFSRDGRWMATVGRDDTVILWDLVHQMKKTVLDTRFPTAPSGSGLAFSPDGEWLAAGGMGFMSIWRTASGEQAQPPIEHFNLVRSIAFSPNGRQLATATRGTNQVRIFEQVDGRWNELPRASRLPPLDPRFGPRSLGFVTDGLLAVAGDHLEGHAIWFEDPLHGGDTFLDAAASRELGECRALSLSLDSRDLVALCGKGFFQAYRSSPEPSANGASAPFVTSGGPKAEIGLFSISYAVAVSNHGDYVAAVDNAGIVHLFRSPSGEESSRMTLPAISVAYRSDGTTLAAGLSDGSVAMWPRTNAAASIRLPSTRTVSHLAISPNERWVATIGAVVGDEDVQIIDIADPHKAHPVQTLRLGSTLGRPLFSPDSRLLAVPDPTGINLIETGSWRRLTHIELPGVTLAAAFTPDGRLLTTLDEHGVRRIDTATWKVRLPMLEGRFGTLKLSPDGRYLAGFAQRSERGQHHYIRQATVWNATTGMELAWREEGRAPSDEPARRPSQSGHQRLIDEAKAWREAGKGSVSPNGAWRVMMNADASALELQDASSERVFARLEHDGTVLASAFSAGGRWLATSSDDGAVRLWPLQAPDFLEMACKLLPRNLTPEEWNAFKLTGPYRKGCTNLP